jgi:glutamate racemase
MMKSKAPLTVGVFDSGLGGLSILGAIRALLPELDYDYCCDNLNFPYGTKSEWEVISAAERVTRLFFNATHLDVLVIACNTASVVALESIRKNLPIPVIGVVPAVKPAAQASKTKVIGVLATPVTVARPYLDILIKNFAADCRVVKVGSSKLVTLAEDKMRRRRGQGDLHLEEIRTEVDAIVAEAKVGLDQLVLGCTHFPLLAEELRQVIPKSVNFVDSGLAVASRVRTVIEEHYGFMSHSGASRQGRVHGFCSGDPFEIYLPGNISGVDEIFGLRKLN